jgi:hypothetical protein
MQNVLPLVASIEREGQADAKRVDESNAIGRRPKKKKQIAQE